MSFGSCSREAELVTAVRAGTWPVAVDPALLDHVAGCSHCRDTALVAEAMQNSRRRAIAVARVASPGAIWWRAQVRRRHQAIERAGRPIMLAQIAALITTVVVACLALWRWWQPWDVGALFTTLAQSATTSLTSSWLVLSVAGVVGIIAVGALAVYLAIAEGE